MAARILRESDTWGDISWDYARGYMDFDTAEQLRASKGVASQLTADGQFGNLTLEESVQ
jgi:hypothetical protein